MAVGFKVAFFCYQIGNGDFLHSFFSTVSYNLENGKWGSRFPTIMNELYQGTLDKDNVETAIVELKKIQLELQAFSPDKMCIRDRLNSGLSKTVPVRPLST